MTELNQPAADSLVIERRFRGPSQSGNGGYTSGRLAAYLGGNATVRLMKPPPLDVPLDVVRDKDEVRLESGGEVIARAWSADVQYSVPPAPSIQSARAAAGGYEGETNHEFSGCFVCGLEREPGDGLRIFAGPVSPANEMVACTWTPHNNLCDDNGRVPTEIIWAALDCPGGWSFLAEGDEIALLGEMSSEILAPLECGVEYIAAGWLSASDGRKRHTGSALYSSEGEVLARARATWIALKPTGQ